MTSEYGDCEVCARVWWCADEDSRRLNLGSIATSEAAISGQLEEAGWLPDMGNGDATPGRLTSAASSQSESQSETPSYSQPHLGLTEKTIMLDARRRLASTLSPLLPLPHHAVTICHLSRSSRPAPCSRPAFASYFLMATS